MSQIGILKHSLIRLTGLMDKMVVKTLKHGKSLDNRLIDGVRTLTAANDPNSKWSPDRYCTLLTGNGLNCAFLNFFSNGISGKSDFGGMASESGVWKRYMDVCSQWKKNSVRIPG